MRMDNFQGWFSSKVTISKFPTVEDVQSGLYDDFEYRINVSDLFRPDVDKAMVNMRSYWFPFGEAFGLSLSSLYGALRVLHEAEQEEGRVLLHCHAGRNRSQVVYDSYYFLKTGEHPKNSKLILNIDDGQLPGIYKMEEFLERCREVFEDETNLRPLDWIKHEMHMRGSGFAT